ncbi:MAG: Crp/Fnr family transcriptional regulator [Burkholderiaceae bacterium]|jgi:CRP/FNR family transcriptional regulator, dissimilatory nitrate respiration regulator|nr:Crp/Fnr family transcriptional regulator [Pseudomonadota bacterium]MDA0846595.1 Crp/Fnr family transcriptional regulator [Pseudomonadota bacterium]MDP4576706.1 Crp/Fnr family transcriptional regulator [Burkholderiaceae bacterium]MDP4669326.1 Crp/Fnr family transcriptional regulator [Burkholderiaceae bacterium]MDP4800485.1 Crp/Fnr family transcriptional regulator [Burkholderiaceae bacterium]
MSSIDLHPEKNIIRVQLRQNLILNGVGETDMGVLERHLSIVDRSKGEFLLHQGVKEMEQYFVLDGILKRVVTNPRGRRMILRFAEPRDIETSYAAWHLKTPTPYSIVAVTKARVAKLPLAQWVDFIEDIPALKQTFNTEVMRLMSEIMGHTITLHLLDAPGRVHRFLRKHPDLLERLPKKELAAYLNISSETLSRLKHDGKI